MANRLAGRRRSITLLPNLKVVFLAAVLVLLSATLPTPLPATPRQAAPSDKTSPQSAVAPPAAPPAPPAPPAQPDIMKLEAQQQRREGPTLFADGDVDIHYADTRLRADHVEYNTATYQAIARGHVQFDHDTEHLQADRIDYNIRSGRGHFEHVTGSIRIEREANTAVLATPNPLSFTADSVDREDQSTYRIYHAQVTVCDPRRPNWTFNAAAATLHVD